MDWLQALILGLVQGLTEFLPVSSSGHLAIGREILGVEAAEDLVSRSQSTSPQSSPPS